jgi:DivIVA domain-containing protein
MPLTPQAVASKVFGPTRMRRGYDENEVDAFLDQVEAELTRLTTENERLRQELQQARNGIAVSSTSVSAASIAAPQVAEPAPVSGLTAVEPAAAATPADDTAVEQRVVRMLVLAQQTADAAVREAQTDADRTRGNAHVEAERVLSEARSRTAEETGALERSKAGLETEIEGLQTFEREYRQRLRAYLEMQLHDLESGKSGVPAVEGRQLGELGGSSDADGKPQGESTNGEDPLAAAPADQESYGGGSPFDTGPEGHHDAG